MEGAKLRPATIKKRLEILRRFAFYLGDTRLLEATIDDLRTFQVTYANLSPASTNIYTRHLRAFYFWAFEMDLIPSDTGARLRVPRVPRAVPHPTRTSDLRVALKCAPGHLQLPYRLAAFAGLRCGEITRLRYEHLDLDTATPVASIDGKGGKQRTVPLLEPIARDLYGHSRGWVALRADGRSWTPDSIAIESHRFLHSIGLDTTMHSMRAFFATMAARFTKDPLLVRDLLGHQSVTTTETYLEADISETHVRLSTLSDAFRDLLGDQAA